MKCLGVYVGEGAVVDEMVLVALVVIKELVEMERDLENVISNFDELK